MREYSEAQRFINDRKRFLDRWYGLSSKADRDGFIDNSKILMAFHQKRLLIQSVAAVGLMVVALGSKNRAVKILAGLGSGILSADLEQVAKETVEVKKISEVIKEHQV